MTRVVATVVYIVTDESILLGLKKRGFGIGYWNGFGGKLQENETLESCAVREVSEEVGLTVAYLVRLGTFEFFFPHINTTYEVHVFRTNTFSGQIQETDEMKPQWFLFDAIPFGEMWKSDSDWFPYLLKGKKFNGRYTFDEQNNVVNGSTELV